MNPSSYSKCVCQNCGDGIEFPTEAAGMSLACPHCGVATTLEVNELESPRNNSSATEILNAFNGTVSRTPVSFFYRLGLMLVSLVMVLLPLIYIGLVCLAGWGVYLYATHFKSLLTMGHGGGRLYVLKLLLYGGPIFIGTILVFFMIKPLFARRPTHAQGLALNPAVEPTVYAFIARICDLVGAPMPKRIDLDCNLNASASFRRGMGSFFGNDLVLTIGLPLVAGFNLQQLAGVIAHEFGHFTQGFGMRLSYVIRSVNFWFARVVYERDAFDVMLDDLTAEAEDWRWMILVNCAQVGVWFSRLILKLLMYFGHGVSSFLLRQMEYDADSYEIKLVGTKAFEDTFRRMHVLSALLKPSYNGVKLGWDARRELPEDFSALLLKHDGNLAPEKRGQLEDTMGLERTGIFDTHPSNGDRIRRARQISSEGVFHLQTPAADLFNNFEVLSKQITQLHYSDDLGIPVMGAKFVSVQPKIIVPDPVSNPLPENLSTEPSSSAASTGGLRLKR